MNMLGLDIGGANLKLADGLGYAQSIPFPLWQQPEQLPSALAQMLTQAPAASSLAVTITGELADCFETKSDGIETILNAVQQAAEGKTIHVYLSDGRLESVQVAQNESLLAAASNWHVLASFVTRYAAKENGLLMDVGSTTCDLIPLDQTGPCATGKIDPERLVSGELVYTGIERSPVCAVVQKLPWRDAQCPVAQELFATTADAYLLLGDLPEDPKKFNTADGRSRTIKNAHARLARAICADTTMFSLADAHRAATALAEAQLNQLTTAASKVLKRIKTTPTTIILSGHGEFLGRRLVQHLRLTGQVVSLTEKLGPQISRSACAHALAVLARERVAQ